MVELVMFNPKDGHMQLVDSNSTALLDKMTAQGWLKNPRLIHMFNPATGDNKNVLADRRKEWEDRGYFANPTMIYHPEKGSRTVPADEVEKECNSNGWFRTPAHFPGNQGDPVPLAPAPSGLGAAKAPVKPAVKAKEAA